MHISNAMQPPRPHLCDIHGRRDLWACMRTYTVSEEVHLPTGRQNTPKSVGLPPNLWTTVSFSKYNFLIRYCCLNYFFMKLVQYNNCLVSIIDTDGLVFSPRASLVTVLNKHACVSGRLCVNISFQYFSGTNLFMLRYFNIYMFKISKNCCIFHIIWFSSV